MNNYEESFKEYWKTNMMDVRLKMLHIPERELSVIRNEIELAFMAGYNLKQ